MGLGKKGGDSMFCWLVNAAELQQSLFSVWQVSNFQQSHTPIPHSMQPAALTITNVMIILHTDVLMTKGIYGIVCSALACQSLVQHATGR